MINPVLLDIPDSFETDRLLIRVPQAGDGPALNAAIRETFESQGYITEAAHARPQTCRVVDTITHEDEGSFIAQAGRPGIGWQDARFTVRSPAFRPGLSK